MKNALLDMSQIKIGEVLSYGNGRGIVLVQDELIVLFLPEDSRGVARIHNKFYWVKKEFSIKPKDWIFLVLDSERLSNGNLKALYWAPMRECFKFT